MRRSVLATLALFFACGELQAQINSTDLSLASFKYTVAEATDWTNLLKRTSGWFGGDGIYTIPLNGEEQKSPSATAKTLFIFSDTMVGEIKNDTLVPGYKMINNSVAFLTGNKPDESQFKAYWDKTPEGKAKSVFIPQTPQTQPGDYYWFGDGFANPENGNVYLFGYRVRNVSKAAFGFKEVGNTLLKVKTNGINYPFTSVEQKDTPFYFEKGEEIGSFGTGIFVNTKKAGTPKPDGYVYVYGIKGKAKQLMVARVLPNEIEQFNKWTFFTGTNWSSKMDDAAVLADQVSNEISVSAMPDGRYLMVFQVSGISTWIGARVGKTPYGPFGPTIKLWDCKDALTKKSYLVYNAKGHPSISAPGELLISYHVNSVEFDKDLKADPQLYRPRFIRLKFQ